MATAVSLGACGVLAETVAGKPVGSVIGVDIADSGIWQARLASIKKDTTIRMGFWHFAGMQDTDPYCASRLLSTNSRQPPSNSNPRMAPASLVRASRVVSRAPTRKAGRLEMNVSFPQL